MLKRILVAAAILLGLAFSPLLHPGYRLMFRARTGNPEAMYVLANEYDKDYGGVVKRDHYKSIYWFKRAAEAGNINAYRDLGLMMYTTPEGPMHWFLLGAEKGNRGCMVEVAKAYEARDGLYIGVPYDQAKADYWWKKAKESKKPGEWW